MRTSVLLAACAAFAVGAPVGAVIVEPGVAIEAPVASSPIVYQGQLSFLDIPVTTTADLRFRLYDDAGAPLGREIGLVGVDLKEGAFEAVLDFGVGFSAGWLEVDVRSPAGEGQYVTLSPRQRIDTLPPVFGDGSALGNESEPGAGSDGIGSGGLISLRSTSRDGSNAGYASEPGDALSADRPSDVAGDASGPRGAGWVMAGTVVFYNGGNVGIGTFSPGARLHVTSAGSKTLLVKNTQTTGGNFGIQAEAGGNTSRAIFARANRTVGQNYGVFAQSLSSRGTGVFGQAASTFGITYGVTGVSKAASGTGVRGLATNAGGTNFGIYGEVNSASAWPGFFEGTDATLDQDVGIRDGLTLFRTNSTNSLIRIRGGGFAGTSFPNAHGSIELGSPSVQGSGFVESPHNLLFVMDNDDVGASTTMSFRYGSANEQMRINSGNGAAVLADGLFISNGIDYAESFRVAHEGLEPGDVVVMVRGDWEHIEQATAAYSDTLLGVVSTRPAFLAGRSFDAEDRAARELGIDLARIPLEGQVGGEANAQRQAAIDAQIARTTRPIALAGRVPVKVDASYGPIRAGDRLTSSATPGHAMVQTRPGPSLGIALEDFAAGTGTIQLLVQPGWTGLSDQQYERMEERLQALEAALLKGSR